MPDTVIVVHGGAGRWRDEDVADGRRYVRDAALKGHRVLREGRSALDAVEASVCVMEDNPIFNCGTGSYLTADGGVEMDALVMDGRSQAVGAVAAVSDVRHPVRLARAVMERTEHCFMVGPGLSALADEAGLQRVAPADLVTPKARQRLEQVLDKRKATAAAGELQDTVGAVALDSAGNLAAATSTGGMTGQRSGRVGDSPLPGSGGWAENGVCAVSTTGNGEAILRVCLAHRVAAGVEAGAGVQAASDEAVRHLTERLGDHCGLISVDATGAVGVAFPAECRMVWASVGDGVLRSGALHGEREEEALGDATA